MVAGLQDDLSITDHQYSIALTITFIPYVIAELPINLVLKRVGAHILIPLLVTLWGIITSSQGFVTSYSGLLTTRFLIGAIEGGLYPALVLFVSSSYKRHEIQIRIAIFSAAAALSGAISGLLAYWFMQLDGLWNIPGWGWIFIIEGIFTTLCGLIGFFIYPQSLPTCRFLNPDQRRLMALRLQEDQPFMGTIVEQNFSWYQVFCAFKSPHVLVAGGILFMVGSNLYGLAYFQPSIVKSFGYSPRMAQLVSVPPFAVGFLAMLATSYISDRYRARGPTAMAMACVATAGYTMFRTCSAISARYFSLFLSTAGIYSVSPTIFAWIANNSAPHYRQATALALGTICANSGGILSTWIFPSSEEPNFPTSTAINLSFSVGISVLCALNLLWLGYSNKKKKAAKRDALGFSGKEHSANATHMKEEWLRLGDRHDDFIYVR